MPESEEALLRRAAWVARKSPWWLGEKSPVSEDLAEPLAAWLDYAAGIAEWSPHIPMMQLPLDVARALLGVSAVVAPEEEK